MSGRVFEHLSLSTLEAHDKIISVAISFHSDAMSRKETHCDSVRLWRRNPIREIRPKRLSHRI